MPVFTPPDPADMWPYATADDVASRWRPLSDAEAELADTLALDVSYRVKRKFPTLDARILAGDVAFAEVTAVVAGIVKRAMIGADAGGAVQSQQDVAGPFSRQVTYANPMGNLYFTAEDLAVLSEGGTGRVRSIRLTSANTD